MASLVGAAAGASVLAGAVGFSVFPTGGAAGAHSLSDIVQAIVVGESTTCRVLRSGRTRHLVVASESEVNTTSKIALVIACDGGRIREVVDGMELMAPSRL